MVVVLQRLETVGNQVENERLQKKRNQKPNESEAGDGRLVRWRLMTKTGRELIEKEKKLTEAKELEFQSSFRPSMLSL